MSLRVLIVKFSSIGDCVMALPVPTVIRRTDPNAFVVWAVDPRCAPVIATSPVWDRSRPPVTRLVDEIFPIPWETWKQERQGMLTHLRHYLKLRTFRFDLAFDLQGRAKTAICLRLCGAKRRLTARAYDPLPKLLGPVAKNIRRHHVEGNLDSLNQMLRTEADPTPILPAWAPAPREPDLITIAVGSGVAKKTYPHFAEVARRLISLGWRVEFLGGPGECAPEVAGATNRVGTLTLQTSLMRVSASQVHVASDTGSGHWAAAVGTPVVSIFGPTDPAEYAPYTDTGVVLKAGDGPGLVSVEAVVEAVSRWRT